MRPLRSVEGGYVPVLLLFHELQQLKYAHSLCIEANHAKLGVSKHLNLIAHLSQLRNDLFGCVDDLKGVLLVSIVSYSIEGEPGARRTHCIS